MEEKSEAGNEKPPSNTGTPDDLKTPTDQNRKPIAKFDKLKQKVETAPDIHTLDEISSLLLSCDSKHEKVWLRQLRNLCKEKLDEARKAALETPESTKTTTSDESEQNHEK